MLTQSTISVLISNCAIVAGIIEKGFINKFHVTFQLKFYSNNVYPKNIKIHRNNQNIPNVTNKSQNNFHLQVALI